MTHAPSASPRRLGYFAGFTAVAATTAAGAAFLSAALAVPVWAMFLGWVAYFTRGHSLRDGALNLACLLLGIAVGIGAATALGLLVPVLGRYALPAVVFAVACVVVSLRAAPLVDNVPCYFLGLIALFAAHRAPTLATFAVLAGAATLGAFAGWLSQRAQARLARVA
jgi:hypothetical protein